MDVSCSTNAARWSTAAATDGCGPRRVGAGTVVYVDEPYLDATVRPEILFPAYVSGRNLAEAFYAGMPYLSWQSLVIGDPLCAPFEGARRTAAESDPGSDAETELPTQFAK